MRKMFKLFWNFAKDITAKAQSTTAIAVGVVAVGYFEARDKVFEGVYKNKQRSSFFIS